MSKTTSASLILYKINCKWIISLHVEAEIVRLSRAFWKEITGLRNYLSALQMRLHETLKLLNTAKEAISRVKKQSTKWEKALADYDNNKLT